MSKSQYGIPMIVGNFSSTAARGLTRVRLEKSNSDYNERWLQKLISHHSSLLPIEQIEPALTPAISICMELPLPSGYIDNFYATPDGDLIIGETKLFRNPESRRAVIGQIIDYAKDLSALSYEDLNRAIRKAEAPDGKGGRADLGLYDAVASAGHGELVEEQFIDAVSRNLERGRFLLLIIGDGIQEGTENIAGFLQQHAGMHFTLGLVDLAIFELPSELGGYLVQPRILARTRNIDRGIVTIENGMISTKPSAHVIGSEEVASKTPLSEEKYYEELARHYPAEVQGVKDFMAQLLTVGVVSEFGRASLILRWKPDEDRAWNLGTITTSGKVWMEYLNMQTDAVGLLNLSHAFLKRIAAAVPGASVKETPKQTAWYVAKGGTYVTIDCLLDHSDEWFAAIQEFINAAISALKNQ